MKFLDWLSRTACSLLGCRTRRPSRWIAVGILLAVAFYWAWCWLA